MNKTSIIWKGRNVLSRFKPVTIRNIKNFNACWSRCLQNKFFFRFIHKREFLCIELVNWLDLWISRVCLEILVKLLLVASSVGQTPNHEHRQQKPRKAAAWNSVLATTEKNVRQVKHRRSNVMPYTKFSTSAGMNLMTKITKTETAKVAPMHIQGAWSNIKNLFSSCV